MKDEGHMMEFMEQYGFVAIAVLILLALIQFIMLLSTQAKLRKLTKRYNHMINSQGVENLEGVLSKIHQQVGDHQQELGNHKQKIDALIKQQPLHKSKIAITRYNAFSDKGSDLSFSMAIIDANKDGVVISGIHSREGGYVYGKPVEKGQSKYSLTPEEIKVIEEAK